MQLSRRGALWIGALLAFGLVGCGGPTSVYPVQGKVTFEGKRMLGGGSIAFVPLGDQAGKTAGGEIAEDGTYQLTTHRQGDGSMVGEFRVVITQVVEKEPERSADGEKVAKSAWVVPLAERIPAIYSDHYKSPLTVTVEALVRTARTVPAILAERTGSVSSSGNTGAAQGWLVGPWFDALLIANVAWPLLVLAQVGEGFSGRAGLQFWQLYWVTTPHRWITLLIVFLDRERFHQRRGMFLGIAVGVTGLCLGVRLTTGALTCLLAMDYLWNAWHFASQHHGIYRIYSRLGDPVPLWGLTLEKWAMRGFLLYVILRVVSATWSDAAWEASLRTGDWFVVIVPLGLVLRDVVQWRANSLGRLTYLISVSGLYLSLLWAVHERRLGLVLSLATASALFHAIEYLSLVSWSVHQRHGARATQMGLLGYLVPRWGIALAVFVLVLGAGGWFMDQWFIEAWLFINVIVAFLHYAYDGLIWRRRSPSSQ